MPAYFRHVWHAELHEGNYVQASDLINSLAVKALLPLAAAAVTVLALPGRYVEAIGIAALCAMGPMSEQVGSIWLILETVFLISLGICWQICFAHNGWGRSTVYKSHEDLRSPLGVDCGQACSA